MSSARRNLERTAILLLIALALAAATGAATTGWSIATEPTRSSHAEQWVLIPVAEPTGGGRYSTAASCPVAAPARNIG